jgi:predicted DNA-binding helix-hairpin-helix protein
LTSSERKFYNKNMDVIDQLTGLSSYMAFEDCDEQRPETSPSEATPPACFTPGKAREDEDLPVFKAKMGGGGVLPILKTALTTACERNCNYCAFRAGRDFRRSTFQPDDMADAFLKMVNRGAVKGMFLSSGVAGGGVKTQDRLIDTAEILRQKRGYRGYLHLKIMPGADRDQVERAMQLADRVSVNLEAPTTALLGKLAPQKVMIDELLRPLRWVEEIRQTQPGIRGWNGRWPSSTTQFVVGAAGETDLDLIRATEYLYRKLHLRRAYYSTFRPVPGTPLEEHTPENSWRTYRLYQASFLLRDYGFNLEDMPFSMEGTLPLGQDPKLAWANQNLLEAPVEVNRADLEQLLRIPGIGPMGARAILAARRKNHLRKVEDLQSLGVQYRRAAPFVLLDGHRPPYQMTLL